MAELTAWEQLSAKAKEEVKAFCQNRKNELAAFALLATMSTEALGFIRKYKDNARLQVAA